MGIDFWLCHSALGIELQITRRQPDNKMAEALGQVPTRDAKLYPPWESNLTDANREKLAALAKRRDKRGHISLESHEMPFVMVDDGSRCSTSWTQRG